MDFKKILFTCFIIILICILFSYLEVKKNRFLEFLKKKKNICLIIAHPDDEIMFFFPTLKFLLDKKKKNEIFLLSLSNGNYYGYGKIREKEFFNIWSYLGGEKGNCKILNNPKIQDGWDYWDEKDTSNILNDYCSKHNIKTILTFDNYGISGHPNHISIFNSIRLLSKIKDINIFILNSTNIIHKYMGFLSFPFLLHKSYLISFFNPLLLLRLMFLYKSQFVYYRILFCIFSQ
ncbi:N-acetylglucosaminylphosphatidylinositol deacetylase, putative [Plasmodium gallinaceum]|uniref:N-acetylglucosaminylphosphatidylinositol deacetylase n=1 Tax=Plasmodium gallinaceum TaxID=5849 RepID=A0A1J1GMZ8_PLAGA|nr:N-acetylglucosaminylphosphatidylinositol deacetylase, putative [Plasmodium gallinaceum]CRG93823.1 N-acetylglucosaminylphosphatidylinositol deacetylase, putative [Plasmodium gallinaceum]